MIKKKLLALPRMSTPDSFVDMAMADELRQLPDYRYEKLMYARTTYVSAVYQDEILKVSLFFTGSLRDGNREPGFDIYIDPAEGRWLVWSAKESRWSGAMAGNLPYPDECHVWHYGWGLPEKGTVWCEQDTKLVIEGALGKLDGDDCLRSIYRYQQDILEDRRLDKQKRELAEWDADMGRVPEMPADFREFADREGVAENHIFYTAGRKTDSGYCTYCRRDVPILKPKYNAERKCLVCGKAVKLKSVGKKWKFWTRTYDTYLIQDIGNEEFVIREFTISRVHKSVTYWDWDTALNETHRYICNKNAFLKHYVFDEYGTAKHRYMRWIPAKYKGTYFYGGNGAVYLSDKDADTTELVKTGLPEMARSGIRFRPCSYLFHLRTVSYLEQIAKAGLTSLAADIVDGKYKPKKSKVKHLSQAIGLDGFRMNRLRIYNGNSVFREWLKYEKLLNTVFKDDVIRFFSDNGIEPKHVDFILDRMTPLRIRNYLDKQSLATGRSPRQLTGTWRDYLDMAKRLKMNVSHELFYKPKDLVKAHDECVRLGGTAEVSARISEIRKKFPDVERICRSISGKYSYKDAKYCIVVPESLADIIYEGRALGHCLDRSDIYFDRIEQRESYIVFLRRASAPDTPYYTLEIEPDGTARQKRTTGDRQDRDFQSAVDFIRKWQKEIRKNLAEEDLKLAGDSARLRAEEFIRLRKEQAKIWHGPLAGKLLADVLEADLLEAAT